MRLRGEPVSSSHIRHLLREGRVSRARHLLARPFSILSTAGRGRGYGSKYTVPTINLARYEELGSEGWRLHHAHARGWRMFRFGHQRWKSPNLRHRLLRSREPPAEFPSIAVAAETEVEIHFLDRLRDEIKFPSVEALREQIGRDVGKAQKYFGD